MTRFILCLLIIFLIPSVTYAKGTISIGDTIPHDLELKDQNQKMRSFSDLTGKKGIVLVFVRSVDWCPYCQKQLIDLDKSTKRFQGFGYNVVSVSYDAPEAMRKFVTKNKPQMTLLSDPRSESIRAFGILNDDVAKGTISYGVPHPGVYVIDKDKKVQAKFFKQGYKERPSTGEILAKIESLNPPDLPPMTMESMGIDPIFPGEEFVEIPTQELPPLVLPGVQNTKEEMRDDVNTPLDTIAPTEGVIDSLEENIQINEDVIDEPMPPVLPEAPIEASAEIIEDVPEIDQEVMDELQDDFLKNIPQPDLPNSGSQVGDDGALNVM